MKLKSIQIAVAVLAALSGAVYFARRPAPPASADARVGQPLAGRPMVEQAAKLRLSDQGKTVLLARQSDGSWRVPAYFDFPADFTKLSTFIATLTDAKVQRSVTSNPERIARLDFKDTKVELLDAADKVLWSVTLGKNAETGGGRYVRFGTENKAYLANLNAWLDSEAKNWADTQILALKAEEIAKVEIPFAGNDTVALSRAKKEDQWTATKTPDGQQVKADRVATFLGALGTLRFSDTVEPADAGVAAAKASERAFKLTTFSGKTYTVVLGRKPEEKKLKPPADLPVPKPEPPKDSGPVPAEAINPVDAKPAATAYETIPAGPVFVSITSSDPVAPINALMLKRAFQVPEYTFTGLPQKPEELFETIPSAAAVAGPTQTETPKKP